MHLKVFAHILLIAAAPPLVGCGAGSSAPSAVHFLYAANLDAGQINGYQVSGVAAQLTPVAGSPFPSNGTRVFALIADPQHRFLYAANAGTQYAPTDNLTTFTVDRTTGALRKVSATATTELGLFAFAAHPSGNYLYASSGTDWASPDTSAIHIYKIGSSGDLTRVGSVSVPAGMGPADSMSLDPSGRFLFAAGQRQVTPYDQGVSAWVYAVRDGGATLSLVPSLYPATPSPPLGSGTAPGILSTSRYVYVPTDISATLGVFQWNSDGTLTTLPSPQLPFGANPFAVAATPDGRFVYMTDSARHAITAFAVGSDGSLSQIQDLNLGTGPYILPEQLIVDSNGETLYVGGGNGSVFVFQIGNDGHLTPAAGSPYVNGSNTIIPIALL